MKRSPHLVCVLADAVTEEYLVPIKAVDCLATVPPAGYQRRTLRSDGGPAGYTWTR